MKKKLVSLLTVGICLCTVLCGFTSSQESEKNPNSPADHIQTFEASGYILEPSQPVAEFTVNIPVQVTDTKGNPVQNAGIIITRTVEYAGEAETVFRERPSLNELDTPILTDHEGRAVISYTSTYPATTLFVFTPEILKSCWGKHIASNEYPACSRYDISLDMSGNMKEISITINPEKKFSQNHTHMQQFCGAAESQ